MNCTECRDALIDHLYGELPPSDAAGVQSHLAACPGCAREVRILQRTRETLDAWCEVPLPAHLGAAREALAAGAVAGRWIPRRWLASPWVPVALGAAAAVITFLLLREYVAGSPLPPMTHILLGVLSGALFGGLFRLALPGHVSQWEEALRRRWGIGPRRAARGALVCTGLGCLLVAALPLPTLFQAIGFAPDSSLSYGLGLLGYSAIAAAGAGFAVRPGGEGRFRHALALACLYAMAMAPGLAIICLPLTATIYLAALAGSLIGATVGGPAGLVVRHRIAA